jgi:hypothetical protein
MRWGRRSGLGGGRRAGKEGRGWGVLQEVTERIESVPDLIRGVCGTAKGTIESRVRVSVGLEMRAK